MRDFYPSSQRMPLDQADGLRRLFAGRGCTVMAIAANPHVAFAGLVLDRLAALLAALGRQVLVVDAAGTSPAPQELAQVDLGACIETLAPRVGYLAARGLPLAHVDTRGSSAGFINAVQRAAPRADVVLMHADAADLVRLFRRRAVRPILLGADHPESIKHAYASAKLLVGRCQLMTFDLLLVSPPHSPRVAAIGHSLADCADRFLGATLMATALVDPAADPQAPADEALAELLGAQLALEELSAPAPLAEHPPRARATPGGTGRPAHPDLS